ncbi:MAG: hypothetical protein CL433_11810, partial [Acidimicrobiaceae bacterium]|nr:hypothetical protein [Acidimicrobiaceae bacterium]
MGERQFAGHVADGVHARNGGLKSVVRLDVAIGVGQRSKLVETKFWGCYRISALAPSVCRVTLVMNADM